MNTQSITWQSDAIAGHDEYGNEITVRELVAAIEEQEAIIAVANMPCSTRDALARQAAENLRLKRQNESLQQRILLSENSLNNAQSRITSLLSEHVEIDHDQRAAALKAYADPKNWANPRNQHGDIQADQRNVFIKSEHGYELAMTALTATNKQNEQAA